jgi:hypothetical protein
MEAVDFLRALKDLEFAAARQNLAAELLEDVRYELGVLLVLIGIVDLRARATMTSSMPTESILAGLAWLG